MRLATTLLKDEESARDNNVLACNFSKYSSIVKKTDGLSSIPFLISLLTSSPHRKYVSAPALQVIVNRFFLALMFHKVVRQRMQRVVGPIITALLQTDYESFSV